MRRIADASAELQKLALGMGDAAHGARRLVAVNDITSIVISRKPDMQQCHNATFPERTTIRTQLRHSIIDTSVTCFLERFECKLYTVEVKRLNVMTEPKSRARRGVERSEILDAAFNLFASVGETAFSIRKLAAAVGVDPMTILHHFGSKAELLRAVADHALRGIEIPEATVNWRNDLKAVANAYRMLAHRHPRVFHLHFRYNATGPADHISSELVYCALQRAGLADAEAAGLGLAFYAFVLGFALAEAEGLLRPLGQSEEAELEALDPETYKATRALIPALKTLDPDAAFDDSMEAFISGAAALADRKPHQSSRKAKVEVVAH